MHPNLAVLERQSATKVFESWIKNRRAEIEFKNVGLACLVEAVLADLEAIVGHGLSKEKFNEYKMNLLKQKSFNGVISYMWNAQASGENMSIK